jgi:hypothetical protein
MIHEHYERVMPTLFGAGNGDKGLVYQWRDWISRSDERIKVADEEAKKTKQKRAAWNLVFAILGLCFKAAMCAMAYATLLKPH